MKLKLIGCDALRREFFALAAVSPHDIELRICAGDALCTADTLQEAVLEETDAAYILLGCGLCAAEGITAGCVPLVVPAAHDCAHLLMGDGGRYRRAFEENDDAPRWITPAVHCRERSSRYGVPCAVISPLGPRPALPPDVREYAADLSFLRDFLNGVWNERFVVVRPGFAVFASGRRDILTAKSL